MLNQFVIVGRIKEVDDEKIVIAVSRNYKNENGEYDSDLLTVLIRGSIADNVNEYCTKGSLAGIKGRVTNEGLIAEKVTFLSSPKNDDED